MLPLQLSIPPLFWAGLFGMAILGFIYQVFQYQNNMLEAQLQELMQACNDMYKGGMDAYNHVFNGIEKNSTQDEIKNILGYLQTIERTFKQDYQRIILGIEMPGDTEANKGLVEALVEDFKKKIKDADIKLKNCMLTTHQKSTIEAIESKAQEFYRCLDEFKESCNNQGDISAVSRICLEASQLGNELKAQVNQVISSVDESPMVDQLSQIQSDFQTKLLDPCLSKLETLKRALQDCLEKKGILLTDLDGEHESIKKQFRLLQQRIPTSEDRVLDFTKMKQEFDALRLNEKFKNYEENFNKLRADVLKCDKTTQESKLLSKANTLNHDFATGLTRDMDPKVSELLQRYAVTDMGTLARKIKDRAEYIDTSDGLKIYKLPVVNEFEVYSMFLS